MDTRFKAMKLDLLSLNLDVSMKSTKIGPEKVHAGAELANCIGSFFVNTLHLFGKSACAEYSHQANQLHVRIM